MWQTKYATAVPNNLRVGFDFWPCSEGDFLTGRPKSVDGCTHMENSAEQADATLLSLLLS
jgi:hypothetical protein